MDWNCKHQGVGGKFARVKFDCEIRFFASRVKLFLALYVTCIRQHMQLEINGLRLGQGQLFKFDVSQSLGLVAAKEQHQLKRMAAPTMQVEPQFQPPSLQPHELGEGHWPILIVP
jgi:hypothetical protein